MAQNKIIYYNKGVAISTNTLKQPPDMITDLALWEAMRIILTMQQQKSDNAYVSIQQNGNELRRFNYNPAKPP